MFADPLVLVSDWDTITKDAASDLSLPAIERAADHSTYQVGPDGSNNEYWTLLVGHQYGRRSRFTARLTVKALTPDLLIDGNNSQFTQSCYVVFDSPNSGPVNINTSGMSTQQRMMKAIGSLLISVDTADPIFMRVLSGET